MPEGLSEGPSTDGNINISASVLDLTNASYNIHQCWEILTRDERVNSARRPRVLSKHYHSIRSGMHDLGKAGATGSGLAGTDDNSVNLLNTPTSLVCNLNAITQCVVSHRNGNGPISCGRNVNQVLSPTHTTLVLSVRVGFHRPKPIYTVFIKGLASALTITSPEISKLIMPHCDNTSHTSGVMGN